MISELKTKRELRHIARLRTDQLRDMVVQLEVLYGMEDYNAAMLLVQGSAVAFTELRMVLHALGGVPTLKGKKGEEK